MQGSDDDAASTGAFDLDEGEEEDIVQVSGPTAAQEYDNTMDMEAERAELERVLYCHQPMLIGLL